MLSYAVNLRFDKPGMETYWSNLLLTTCEMYNRVSERVFNDHLGNYYIIHQNCYRMLRRDFPEVPSQVCIKVEQDVASNYKAYKKRNKKFPNEPLVRRNPSLHLDMCLYSGLTPTGIRLSSGKPNAREEVKFELYAKFSELASHYPMRDPLIRLKDKKLQLVVPFDAPAAPVLEESLLGVDLGLRRIATTSEGVAFTDKAYLKNRRGIRHQRRILQSKKRHSSSAKRKLKKIRRKEANVSKNFAHHLANSLLKTDKTVLVLEDLTKIKQKTAKTKGGYLRKRHNSALSQVPFSTLKAILTYKAALVGKQVRTVSPFNTSKMDCRNSSIAGCERHGCRFRTSDGVVFDADWNASINIAQRIHPISFRLPLDGQLNLIGRHRQQANSGSPSETCKPSDL